MNQSEGSNDAAAPVGGSRSAITASVLSLAPRLASTSARAAAPSRARPHRIRHQRAQRLVELAFGVHLDGRRVGHEGVGDLLEVLHVRSEHDRLAEDRGLEDVVAAMVGQAAADEHRRRELVELRELAKRVEHDDVRARIGVDRQIGSPHGDEAFVTRQPFDFAETRRDDAAPESTALRARSS